MVGIKRGFVWERGVGNNCDRNAKLKEKVLTVFRKLENNGGPDGQKILKTLCPTLSGV